MTQGILRLAAATVLMLGVARSAAAAPDLLCRSIAANGGWQTTGLTLSEGDAVCVAARGVWSHGPESGDITPWHGPAGYLFKNDQKSPPIVPFPFAKVGALLGKIGEMGLAFPIDDGLCFVVRLTDGNSGLPAELHLAMNDAPASFADNEGTLRVAVAVGGDGVADRLVQTLSRGSCLR